jgi:hypothetical protein
MVKLRTSSFFSQKIEWYREKNRYHKALNLLSRRLERKFNTLLKGKPITTKNIIEMVKAKEPAVTRHKIRRISRFMDTILWIKTGKKVKDEKEFENLFYEMEWIIKNT